MPTVIGKTKAAFDEAEMNKRTGKSEKSEKVEHTYYHPLNKTGDIKAYLAGSRVKTDSGEHGSVSHVKHGEGIYPHAYRVSSLEDANKRLENGNYISHTRLMPMEAEQDQHERAKSHPKYEKLKSALSKQGAMDAILKEMNEKQ